MITTKRQQLIAIGKEIAAARAGVASSADLPARAKASFASALAERDLAGAAQSAQYAVVTAAEAAAAGDSSLYNVVIDAREQMNAAGQRQSSADVSVANAAEYYHNVLQVAANAARRLAAAEAAAKAAGVTDVEAAIRAATPSRIGSLWDSLLKNLNH
jgi:hypothetical protein